MRSHPVLFALLAPSDVGTDDGNTPPGSLRPERRSGLGSPAVGCGAFLASTESAWREAECSFSVGAHVLALQWVRQALPGQAPGGDLSQVQCAPLDHGTQSCVGKRDGQSPVTFSEVSRSQVEPLSSCCSKEPSSAHRLALPVSFSVSLAPLSTLTRLRCCARPMICQLSDHSPSPVLNSAVMVGSDISASILLCGELRLNTKFLNSEGQRKGWFHSAEYIPPKRYPLSLSHSISSKKWVCWHVDCLQCFRTVVLEKTLENPLDRKDIKPVHPKGNQP